MKKRSLLLIAVLNLFTLGLYELYWLISTRNEIVREHNLTLPSGLWLLLSRLTQLSCLIAVSWICIFALPANQRNRPSEISKECVIQQFESASNRSNADKKALSQDCRQQIAAENQYTQKQENVLRLLTVVLLAFLTSLILLGSILKRWYAPYANAISIATDGKLSGINAMLLLTTVPFGTLFIQNEFNKLAIESQQ